MISWLHSTWFDLGQPESIAKCETKWTEHDIWHWVRAHAHTFRMCLLGTANNEQCSSISDERLPGFGFALPIAATIDLCVMCARERKLRMSVCGRCADWPKSPSNLDIENETKDKNSHALNGLIGHWASTDCTICFQRMRCFSLFFAETNAQFNQKLLSFPQMHHRIPLPMSTHCRSYAFDR